MPATAPAPTGAPCWVELLSSDPDRATEFYGAIFGWTADAPATDFGGHVNFRRNGVLIAGMMRNDGPTGQPDVWSTYLSVSDAKATTEAAVAAGAQVYVEPMEVGDLGSMSVVADPGGAAIGMWQPGAHQGSGLHSEPGAPCWYELHTRDHDGSLAFYRTVFGAATRPMSEDENFRYSVLVVEGNDTAGVLDAGAFLPDGVPSNWQVYIGVEDVDAALATAVELGGTVLMPAEDSPFGRLAQIADPTGASIKLVGVPAV